MSEQPTFSPPAEKLVREINEVSTRAFVMTSGLAALLRLLVSWVLSVEMRLHRLEKSNHVET